MFEAYTVAPATYETNASVAFTDIRYEDCRVLTSGASTIRVNAPGRYYVEFHAVASSDTAASPFTIALYRDDVAVPAVVSTITSTAAGDEQTMSLSTIINVLPSNCYINNETRLRLVVTSEAPGTITSGNVVIYRLK